VIIPTHSRPDLLPRAVESAKNAGTDVEVIVVDDASVDSTAEVCRKLDGIKYIRVDRNQQVAGARNLGILASSAEYIAFLDDDDVRLPGSLDIQVEALDSNREAGFVYGRGFIGDNHCVPTDRPPGPKEYLQGDVFWDLLENNFVPCLATVFRKACLYRVGLLDEALAGIDDWDLWIRIAELYPVMAVRQPVAIWRAATPDSGQGTSNLARILTLAVRTHRRKWLKLPRAANAPPEKLEQIQRRFLSWVSDRLIWTAADGLSKGHTIYGRNNLLAALRLNPARAARPWTFKLLASSLINVGTTNRASSITQREQET
jgi:glycosyltransferase involved in cell wall biosynthesis